MSTEKEPIMNAGHDRASAKRMAFVAAARAAFFANGYAGTTMSSVAASVGGSKSTLWKYFPSKEDLFAAVVDDIVEKYGRAHSMKFSQDEDVFVTLRCFLNILIATTLSKAVISLHRLIVSEAQNFPSLSKLYYERGPMPVKNILADYLESLMRRGTINSGDPSLAAQQLIGMVQSGAFQDALLGLRQPSSERLKAEIDVAINSFCLGWMPRNDIDSVATSATNAGTKHR